MATTNIDNNYIRYIEKISDITRRAVINNEDVFFDRNIFPIAFSSLIKIKERMMSKYKKTSGGQEIYFDILASRKILHDILFMSFLIKKEIYLKGDVEKKNNFLTDLQAKKNIVVLDSDVDAQLSQTFDLLDFDMTNGQVIINNTSLAEVIKEAVAVLEIMRNSFGHNENGKNCYLINDNSVISINNNSNGNRLFVDFDYEYFVDFCYGIKPLVKDYDVLRIVDDNHAHIFNELSLSAKDSLDIFYSSVPSRIADLFELVNHDYDLLINLPTVVFSKFVSMERILFLVKDRDNNIDYDKVRLLKKLPVSLFYDKCSVDRIKMLATDDVDFNILINLPDSLFSCSDNIFDVKDGNYGIYFLITNCFGFEINRFKELSSRWFSRSTNSKKVKFLIEHFNNFDDLVSLNSSILKNDYPLYKIIKVFGDCKNIEIINSLPLTIFSVDYNFSKYDFLVAQIKKENPSLSHVEVLDLLSKLPVTIFTLDCELEVLKNMLKIGTEKEVPISKLIGLNEKLFTRKINMGILNYFIEKDISCDDLKEYPIDIFSRASSSEFIVMLDKLGFDMKRIPAGMCLFDKTLINLKYLYGDLELSDRDFIKKYFIPGVDGYEEHMEFIQSLPRACFANYMKLERFKFIMESGLTKDMLKYVPEYILVNRYDKNKLQFAAKHDLFVKLNGPSNIDRQTGDKILTALFNRLVPLELFEYLCDGDYSVENIMNLHIPVLYSNFSLDFLKQVTLQFGGIDKLKFLPDSFFLRNSKESSSNSNNIQTRTRRKDYEALSIVKYFYDVLENKDFLKDVPDWCFSYNCNLDRAKYLYERVNYNFNSFVRLPKELFLLDNDKIDAFFNSRSNITGEMMKSLFGFNNSKSLALNLYFSTLSSVYDPDDLEQYFCLLDTSNIDMFIPIVGDETNPYASRFFPSQGLNNLDLVNYLSNFDASVRNDVTSYINHFVNDSFSTSSTVDLLNKYKEVMGILDGWGDLFLNKFNRQFARRFRNSADHFRSIISDEGLIIMDGELIKNSSGLNYVWNTSCYASYSNWFKYTEQLKSIMLKQNMPSNGDEQRKKILINFLKVRRIADDSNVAIYENLIDDFIAKINKLRLEVKELFVLLMYMKEKGNVVSQVTAVSSSNYSLLSLHSGFNIYSDYSAVSFGSSCVSILNTIEGNDIEKERLNNIRRSL